VFEPVRGLEPLTPALQVRGFCLTGLSQACRHAASVVWSVIFGIWWPRFIDRDIVIRSACGVGL
jgi:hypothetical protein